MSLEFQPNPAELGSFKTAWTNSYNGQKAFFISNSVLLYRCGPAIKFFNAETKELRSFVPPHILADNTNSLCLLTANSAIGKFAFSETQLATPKVFVFDYPSKQEVSKLCDGALIEYLAIEFSNSEAILTLSGIPDLEIIIWNWRNGEKINSIKLETSQIPKHMSFSPVNWRNVAIAYENEIKFHTIEQFDQQTVKTMPSRIAMPKLEDSQDDGILADFTDEFDYPTNAITNVDDESGEVIDEILDRRKGHSLKCLCWISVDEILIATKHNSIFRYRLNDKSMRLAYKPDLKANDEVDNHEFKIDFTYEIDHMVYHRQGIFATCNDGMIRLIDGSHLIPKKGSVQQTSVHVKKALNVSTKFISNVCFNSRFSLLLISSDKGIFVLDHDKYLPADDKKETVHLEQFEKQNLLINFDHGKTVAVSSLSISKTPSYYILKETGCLQIWNAKIGQIANRFHLNEPCSNMAMHPKYPMGAIGTVSGRIIFLDLTDENVPKIIENCRIHRKQIKHLRFNSSGTLLFSVGEDNKLFVIDTRLNEETEKLLLNLDQRLATNYPKIKKFEIGFYLLGYIEFDGEAVALDVLDYLEDEGKNKNIISRVALAIHDKSAWEVVRKNIQEIMPSIISPNSPTISESISLKSSNSTNSLAAFNTSIAQNVLFQTCQMDPVISRSAYTFNLKDVNYDSSSTKENVKLACKAIVFDFNFNMFSDKSKIYATRRLDYKDDVLMKSTFHSHFLFSDLVLSSRSSLVCSTEKFLTRFNIPEYEANKKASKVVYLELNDIVGMQDLGYSCMNRCLNNQFVVVGGYDGSISVRKISDLKSYTDTKVSHFTNGGVEKVKFTHDGTNLIVLNHDNSLMNLNWICNFDPTVKLIRNPIPGEIFKPSVLKDLVSHINFKPENEMSWFTIKEIEFFKEQDAQYLPIRKEIIDGLNEINLKLQELMAINSSRDDLSKLKEHEFYLDLDELERLHKETEAEIQKIREKTELDNLAKLYVREIIKKDCWDNMSIKGRGIQAFNTNLLVENYALKERTRNELNVLERMKALRRIEISAQKTCNEVAGELMRKDNVIDLIERDEDETRDGETVQAHNNSHVVNSYLSPNLSLLAFKGSIGSLFNGDSNLFYNQFELYTREQKWIQIILIQDAIYRIKENFNKEFEQVMQRKNHEIAKIREKNQRLKQIYVDLSEDKSLPEPQFGDAENPETLFEVKDEEIKVEKYLTAEQRKQLEEQEAELAKRRELEKLDNWRERGLMDMMGGVLQIRREDELKKDIPPPPFMEKPDSEWTPEEVKQYQAYEQKIKELNEEREKLKKQLNTEINKINDQILECYQNFDSQLLALHLRKVKTQQAVYQEELKILRLANSLIIDTELETYENQTYKKLESLKEEKKDLIQEMQSLKKELETAREEYEILSAEDKSQEKAFSREFSDVPPAMRDQLIRLYKRRAKNRMQISKTNANPPHVYVPELGSDNPFSDRPTTAQQLNIYDMDTEATLAELDDYDNNAPGGVDRLVWDRFIFARRQKILMENNLRLKGLAVNDMTLYLQKRMDDDEHKRKEIDELTKNTAALQELRLKSFHNLQIQLLMKQGQVEIDSGPHVHKYENCLLIHRNVVESLNKIIQAHGKQKISIMVDCKDYKKGIRQLEWEHRKMSMTIEDYIQKQRDITYLRLSREVQDYLNYQDYDAKKQKEIAVLEQTLAYQTKQFEKVYGLKAKKLKDINKQAVKIANNNHQFDENLVDKNVILHERKHINEEMTGKTAEAMREERFQQIIQRRKLVDLAKAQAQEVAFLRSEVERLRMKTFPALVQIEF